MSKRKPPEFIPCSGPRVLPEEHHLLAAADAISINPANRPPYEMLHDVPVTPAHLAVLTSKYWGPGGVKLGVAFLDTNDGALKSRILEHMNAWHAHGNILFQEASRGMAEVRITRTRGSGYWSYLGTDIRHIPSDQPTMNLEGFTMSTPESEYRRVVRHETGHTAGFPHSHLRQEIIARLDPRKTLAYFRRTQGWSDAQTTSNVLTPLNEADLIATPQADETSIMAYQLPGSITRDGRPIVGGKDINAIDAAFVARIYPNKVEPPVPPPGPGVDAPAEIVLVNASGKETRYILVEKK